MNKVFNVSMFPPQIKIHHERARLIQHTIPTSCKITRQRGGYTMQSKPIRMEIDNRAFFDSLGFKSIDALAQDLIAKGKKAVEESTARYGIEGDILAQKGKDAIKEIAHIRNNRSIEKMLVFIPKHPPKFSWKDGYVDIEYTPDRLHFEWQIGKVSFEYQPYSLTFSI
ncbi:MAG: DUF6470 family protein [Bacillota bacterium]|jgi:hypothetical protein